MDVGRETAFWSVTYDRGCAGDFVSDPMHWAKPCPGTRQVHGTAFASKAHAGRSHRKTELAVPKLQAQFASLGGTTLAGSPADFAKLISDEVKKWSRVIVAANMKRE